MTRSDKKRSLDTNKRISFVGDRIAERMLFLDAIRKQVPKVLQDLFDTLMPLHLQARERRSKEPDAAAFHSFWSPQYDIDTWQAAWEWASRAYLAKGMNIELLKTPEAIELAHWLSEEPHWRRRSRTMPSSFRFPFRIDESPELTFGIPLMEVVWFTLERWAMLDNPEEELCWALLPRMKPLHEQLNLDNFKRILANPVTRQHFVPHLGPPPHTYEF